MRRPTASEIQEALELCLPMPDTVQLLPDQPEPRFVPVEADQSPFL